MAKCYEDLINSIGVKINRQKSVISDEFVACEFASKLLTADYDISPLPLGLIGKKDLLSKFSLITRLLLRSRYSGET